ncbi:cytokinin dehydrogenase 3-like [Nymphaea colorata]|nr:cytokinin dehydrogenase 3-like [Nymphaea colorata]
MDSHAITRASTDFGRMHRNVPSAVFRPPSTNSISAFIKLSYESVEPFPITARGHAHSLHGQAQAGNGVVIEMMSLNSGAINNENANSFGCSSEEKCYIDVGGGELWIDVLRKTLKHGLAPRSWTDYLYLTVGGTLSNGGISGQSFRHGPQISNVLELDVITGKGETQTCSRTNNSELFNAALGGLGQFGIITRARIILEKAPKMVRWVRLLYSDFSGFTRDQELLVSSHGGDGDKENEGFDYVEGFVMMADKNDGNSNWRSSSFQFPHHIATNNTILYCLELCKYYNDRSAKHHVDEELEGLMSKLHYIPRMMASKDVTYMAFLNRVRHGEIKLRSRGLWNVPHPWLCLFVPASRILEFHDVVFKGILSRNNTSGPLLVYPMKRSRWDDRMSAIVPNEEVFYSVGLLRSAVYDWEFYEEQNREICKACERRKLGVKMYLPYYTEESEWRRHFGAKWSVFLERKSRFDPRGILGTGQRIFPFPLLTSNLKSTALI